MFFGDYFLSLQKISCTMKKLLLLFLLLAVTMTVTAQNNTDNFVFPKKGYHIAWNERTVQGIKGVSCDIKKLKGTDSLYYITYNMPNMKPYNICFGIIGPQGARIVAHTMDSLDKKSRIAWIKEFLECSKAYEIDEYNRYNNYWTYFKPNVLERKYAKHWDIRSVIYAYRLDRDKDARRAKVTPEQWLGFFDVVKEVLPVIGGDGDSRTLYDKIMQDGGY